MGSLLEIMGHEVRLAHDGLEAVEVASGFRPDVVLMDIGMPRQNGYDAARWIRARPWAGSTVLIALTGWGQLDDKARAREAGFDYHFTKPAESRGAPDACWKASPDATAVPPPHPRPGTVSRDVPLPRPAHPVCLFIPGAGTYHEVVRRDRAEVAAIAVQAGVIT